MGMRMVRARMTKMPWKSNTPVVSVSGTLAMGHGHCEVWGRLSTIPMGDMGTSVLYHNILQPNTSSSVLARLLFVVVIDNLVSV